MDDRYNRWSAVQSRIALACQAAGRAPDSVRLLAVSKQHSAAAIRQLHTLGQHAFGENRLDEALHKQAELADLDIEWHFIGAVQSNKTRELAGHFDWVQSVDREKILLRLSEQRPASQAPLNICLQLNIDDEPQKAGLAPAQLEDLAERAARLPGVRLRGLMCIPRADADAAQTRRSFARMRELFTRLCAQGHALDTLSMGMSGDLELAVAEGSTMLRVGTDLFGPRQGDAARNPLESTTGHR